MDKKQIRIRNSKILPDHASLASTRICEKLLSLASQFDKVFLFHPFRVEPDLTDLKFHFETSALPKVLNDSDMDFFVWRKKLIQNKYGIMEPEETKKIIPDDSSVIVIPGVGFNLAGYRVGYGAGYYDRYLDKNPLGLKVGVCWHKQICDFNPDKHDIKMDVVITEKEIIQTK